MQQGIVGFFKHSTSGRDILINDDYNHKKIMLVQQVKTRWNSGYDMSEQFVVLKLTLRNILGLRGKYCNFLQLK